MKNLYFLALLLAFPFLLLAQNIHGLWTGTLVNDSTHRTQNFELGLTEYRGKITGYTYTTFIDNDTFYYSIKRIRAERKENKLVIEDVEMIGNNFPQRAAKHVKQTTTFPLVNDSTIDISNGRWSTNQTKKYYSIGGTATIKEQDEEKESDLLAHLEEANVKADIAVKHKEKKEEETVVKNYSTFIPQQKNDGKASEAKMNDVVRNSKVKSPEPKTVAEISNVQKTNEVKSLADNNKKESIAPANNNIQIKETSAKNLPTNPAPIIKTDQAPQKVATISNKSSEIKATPVNQTQIPEQKKDIVKPAAKETNQAVNTDQAENKVINTISTNTPSTQKKDVIGAVKELPAAVASRKNTTVQDIYFKNDSLVLSLYDNGIVDGDTVSVFLNGETIVSKQMLKIAATKKVVYISDKSDSVELVLFADNLGSIPPNTGLLTVRDGDDIYQVRFSADLQRNASIILRRKKDQ